MQLDFHYYATCLAAYIAGYSVEDSIQIATFSQFTDECTVKLLKSLGAPKSAATTQLNMELMDYPTDPVGLQEITRIWASFHFLPRDLKAPCKAKSKKYRNKYRLI